MMRYNCAIDGGNSTINIVINGERFPIAFPSQQADPTLAIADYNNAVNEIDTTLKNGHQKLHVNVSTYGKSSTARSEQEFVFGHMAERYTKDLRSRQSSDKSNDEELVRWMLTALAYSLFQIKVNKEDYKLKENDHISFNILLATGLPYRESSRKENKDRFANMFAGRHQVQFKHPAFKNLTVELLVERVFVYTEGKQALTLELNKEGGIYETTANEELLNKKMTLIDIGGHTTEFVTIGYEMVSDDTDLEMGDFYDEYSVSELEVKQVTLTHLTYGLDKGIGTVMEDVITEVDNEYRGKGKPLRNLTRRDIELAFTIKGMKDGKVGYIKPENIYITPIFNRLARNLAKEIVDKTHAVYMANNVASEIDTIFLCGGGSRISVVVDTIREEFGKLGYDRNKIVVVDDPIFSNAKGYYLDMLYDMESKEYQL